MAFKRRHDVSRLHRVMKFHIVYIFEKIYAKRVDACGRPWSTGMLK